MSEHMDSEQHRRVEARAHRGEVVEGSGRALEGRDVAQMVSVRLDSNVLAELRRVAQEREVTVSQLLRQGAQMVLNSAGTTDIYWKVSRLQSGIQLGSHGGLLDPSAVVWTGSHATFKAFNDLERDDEAVGA